MLGRAPGLVAGAGQAAVGWGHTCPSWLLAFDFSASRCDLAKFSIQTRQRKSCRGKIAPLQALTVYPNGHKAAAWTWWWTLGDVEGEEHHHRRALPLSTRQKGQVEEHKPQSSARQWVLE